MPQRYPHAFISLTLVFGCFLPLAPCSALWSHRKSNKGPQASSLLSNKKDIRLKFTEVTNQNPLSNHGANYCCQGMGTLICLSKLTLAPRLRTGEDAFLTKAEGKPALSLKPKGKPNEEGAEKYLKGALVMCYIWPRLGEGSNTPRGGLIIFALRVLMTNSLLSTIPSKRNPLESYKACTVSSRLLWYLDGNQALGACQVHQLQTGLSGREAVGIAIFPSKSDGMGLGI